VIVLAALSLTALACSDDGGSSGDAPLVVATHSILGDLAVNVLGEQARVEVVMPAGTDPHEFEPSAAQIALLSEADLVIANGLGFEAGLDDALDAAADDGVPVLELGDDLDPLPLADGSDHDEEGEGDEHEDEGHGEEDPHWFTDPLRMARAAGLVSDAAADVEGFDLGIVERQAEAYVAAIEAADAGIATDLGTIPDERRKLVTNHEVFGYFADRYGFEVVGTVVPSGSTLAEPSSADLAALVEVIEETGVPAIFADTSSSAELAEVIAEETGDDVEVVELFSESLGEEGSGAETYLDLIRTNADRIVGALA
jgi:zinc/manganese transport system substrate-binding protein